MKKTAFLVVILLFTNLATAEDHGPKTPTLGAPSPDLILSTLETGKTATIGDLKVNKMKSGLFSICEGDACTVNQTKAQVLARLAGGSKTEESGTTGKNNLDGLFGAPLKAPVAIPMKPKPPEGKADSKAPVAKAPPGKSNSGGKPKIVGDKATYDKFYREETAEFVVMTYSDKGYCSGCRSLYGEGLESGDTVLPSENTLVGLAKSKSQANVSFYVLDTASDADIQKMFTDTTATNIPYTQVYRRLPGGRFQSLGAGYGPEWLGAKLETLKKKP